ncbi:MAG: Ig-like domain-containing protein [Anaerolineales bacterium]
MKKTPFILAVCLAVSLLSFLVVSAAFAQTEHLTLGLSRDWGYGGFNGDIEGLFSMRVSGPADLARVEYYIDNTRIGEVTKAPFNLQFTTDNYPLGSHQLYAVGYSTTGQEYRSNSISANFVPKQSSLNILLPVLGIVLLAIILSALVPFLTSHGKHVDLPLGAERKYGAGGGGICPNCHRPFALPLLSAHVGFSKLAVCPYCGKWSLVRVEPISKLREAEKAELEKAGSEQPSAISEEEKLREEIDDSKYQGS